MDANSVELMPYSNLFLTRCKKGHQYRCPLQLSLPTVSARNQPVCCVGSSEAVELVDGGSVINGDYPAEMQEPCQPVNRVDGL